MANLASEKKSPSAAATALDNFPKDVRTLRHEFVEYVDALAKESKEAANKLSEQKKRRQKIFNCDDVASAVFDKLRVLTQERRDAVLTQVAFLLTQLDLIGQQDLFHNIGQAGGLEKEEGKAVFDQAGNKAAPLASEREPVKKLTGAEPPPHVPTPGIPLDEAQRKFEEANAKGKAARGEKDPTPADGKGGAEDGLPKGSTPKPPGSPKKAAAAAVTPPPSSRSAQATAKDSTRRMSRPATPSEQKALAKKTADKYFKDPEVQSAQSADKNDDGDAPGNFRVH